MEWDKDEELTHLRSEVKHLQRELAQARALIPNSEVSDDDRKNGLYLFGYGSLIWNVGSTPFVEKRVCQVFGFRRSLSSRSTDHRGTPVFPGRTATLIPDQTAVCQGLAYLVPVINKIHQLLTNLISFFSFRYLKN